MLRRLLMSEEEIPRKVELVVRKLFTIASGACELAPVNGAVVLMMLRGVP